MQNRPIEIDEIVQSCLELILSGQETIESALDDYPEFAEIIRPEIEVALWLYSRNEVFDPRPGYVRASRRRLIARIQEDRKVGLFSALGSRVSQGIQFFQSKRLVQATTFVVLILLLFVGTSRAAYAARNSIPGDLLYPIKIAQERVTALITFSPANNSRLHAEYAQRRLIEIQEIILEGRYKYIQSTVQSYESEVEQALESLNEVAKQDQNQANLLAQNLQQVLSSQSVILAILSETVPDATKGEIQWALHISEEGIQSAAEIRNTGLAFVTPVPAGEATSTSTPANTLNSSTPLIIVPTGLNTATPFGTPTHAPTETATLTRTPTRTIVPRPTNTSISGQSSLPTNAPTSTATLSQPTQPIPSATSPLIPPTSTNTPRPTDTDTPVPTTPPTATNTPYPTPTDTPINTATNTPTYTSTATPVSLPTNTPVPTVIPGCAQSGRIVLLFGNKLDFQIENNGPSAVVLDSLSLVWPAENINLKEILLGGVNIWKDGDDTSPTEISNWNSTLADRLIPPGKSKILEFVFKISVVKSSGYDLNVNFDNGCSLSDSR